MAYETIPVLTDPERVSLFRELKISSRYPTGRRNSAMIALALFCGLRSSEIVGHEKHDGGGLRIRDIDWNSGQITLRNTKDTRAVSKRQKKQKAGRIVWAPVEAMALLRTYWQDRALGDTSPDSFLFVTRTGSRVLNREFRASYSRYALRAGLPVEKRNPHALRHTCATTFVTDHTPLHIVQAMLGHKSLATTQKYLHASGEDIRQYMQGGKPV